MRRRIAVFIVDQDKLLLLYRRKNGREYYVVPGGGIEGGETEEMAAIREIKEETDLDIILGEKIGALEIDGENQSFYIAKTFRGEPKLGGSELGRQSPDNFYRLEWIPPEKLDGIDLREEIRALLYLVGDGPKKLSDDF